MRKVILISLLITLQSCSVIRCKVFRNCISNYKSISNIKETFLMEDYDWYVFQMYESESEFFEDENTAQDLAYPSFTTSESAQTKIVEETYLLIPKDAKSDIVIYITTFSHRHIYEKCGVFNCPTLKDKLVFVEDIDKVYTGKLEPDKIVFYDKKKKSKSPDVEWNVALNRDSVKIKNVTLYPTAFKNSPQVDISSVFPLEMVFKLQSREIIYGKGDTKYDSCFSKCEIKLNAPKSKFKNIGIPVTEINLTETKFYFSTIQDTIKENYGFWRKRMPFVYKR